MTEIEKVKQEIKMLQSKLEFLEELENHKDQEVREAFKEVYGHYPMIDGNDYYRWEGKIWFAFQKGYEAAQSKEIEVKECPEEYIKLPTLYEIVADWWDEIFLHNNDAGETIESLIDTIAEDWFFEEDKDEDRYACGWNDCLEKLKLRLK